MLIAAVAAAESGPTVSCTVVKGAALARFSVTPLIAPVTVLVALLSAMPSRVKDALVPPAGGLKTRLVAVLVVIASAPGVPVDWL